MANEQFNASIGSWHFVAEGLIGSFRLTMNVVDLYLGIEWSCNLYQRYRRSHLV